MNVKEDSEELKIRVLQAKKKLPKSGITSLFFNYFKEIKKTPKTYVKINNVLQLRITDQDYTKRLEQLVDRLDSSIELKK